MLEPPPPLWHAWEALNNDGRGLCGYNESEKEKFTRDDHNTIWLNMFCGLRVQPKGMTPRRQPTIKNILDILRKRKLWHIVRINFDNSDVMCGFMSALDIITH